MDLDRLRRRVWHWVRLLFSRRTRIRHGMLSGRYTINQGRILLGLPPFTDRNSLPLADQYIRVDRRGVWVLDKKRRK